MTPNRRDLLATLAAGGAIGALPGLARAATASSPLAPVLQAIADDILINSPEAATQLGLDRGAMAPLAARGSDLSLAERARDEARTAGYRKQLLAFDRGSLSDPDKTRYDAVLFALDFSLAGRKFGYGDVGLGGGGPYVVSQQGGTYSQFAEFLDSSQHVETLRREETPVVGRGSPNRARADASL